MAVRGVAFRIGDGKWTDNPNVAMYVEERKPDISLPVIDLKKEKPVVSKPFISDTFRLQDVSHPDTSDLYERYCIAYAFKEGKLYLTFDMNTADGPKIQFRKKMLRRVRITHYSGAPADATPCDSLVYDYHIEFMYLETKASRDDYNYDYAQVTLTLVYKILEW
jgi:hypothetical protein